MKKYLSLLFLIGIVSFTQAQQYKPVDSKSEVKFTIKNFGLNTSGTLSGLNGTIAFDSTRLSSSSFNISVDVKTINTGIDMRDNHLKKEEYFNVEKYPAINFRSTFIQALNNGYTVTGQLTIKGISKNVSFPFKAVKQDNGLLFTGSFSINRKDFGIGGSSAVMGNNVDISLKILAQ